MRGIKHYIKREMDVEFFGSVHGMSFIFLFGFFEWINNRNMISFSYIVQMWIVGYFIAWFQKSLFLGNHYKKYVYKACVFAWNVGPIIITIIAQIILKWFSHAPLWEVIAFNVIIAVYFIIMWIFLEVFYREDTNELNGMLNEYKKYLGNEKE